MDERTFGLIILSLKWIGLNLVLGHIATMPADQPALEKQLLDDETYDQFA